MTYNKSMNSGVLGLIFGTYTALTFYRRSLPFVSHVLRDHKLLTTQQLGATASLNAFVFAVSKFLAWTYVHRTGPKVMLLMAIIFASMTSFLMPFCSSFAFFLGVWALAGVSHGCSWPPCGYFVRNVCTVEYFGMWWGIISSSSNFSALAGPLLTSFFLSTLNFGWESIFIFNGLTCLTSAIVVAWTLPTIKQSKVDTNLSSPKVAVNSWKLLFTDQTFLLLCLAYIVLSTVKFSFANWIQLCLIDSNVPMSIVVYYVTFMELGGMFGAFSSGFIADFCSKFLATTGKSKILILLIYTISIVFTLHWLQILVSQDGGPLFSVWWNAAIMGVLVASCYSLFGMLPMEIVERGSAGRYSSIMDLAGSTGSLFAGYPISLIQSYFGWSGVITCLQGIVIGAGLTLWLAFNSVSSKHVKIE